MKTVGDKLESFKVTGVKPGFNHHEENGISAFEDITESSFPGKWKVIYFYPKDFTFVCPTEIAGFDKLAEEFACSLEAVTAEPAEELLGTVRRHEESDHHAGEQERQIEKGSAGEILLHGESSGKRPDAEPDGARAPQDPLSEAWEPGPATSPWRRRESQ